MAQIGDNSRMSALNVVCPVCQAAIGARCTDNVINAAGKQLKFRDDPHPERKGYETKW